MKAVSVLVKLKGEEDERTFEYMAKCFPMNPMRVKFLKTVNML